MSTASSRPHVELRLPADSAFVSVLRTTSAGLAARLDFTLDDIEDLRMAVGEACAIALAGANEGGDLLAEFWLEQRTMTVRVSAAGAAVEFDPEEDFAWQVLATLASDAALEHTEDTVALRLQFDAVPLETGV